MVVNCARLPRDAARGRAVRPRARRLHRRRQRRDGRFQAADGGTLFLDEIAELPLPAQAKLLRVLQEGTIEPLGTNRRCGSTCGSSRRPTAICKERIADGLFREDLYYRINVLEIDLPPLRERTGDLPLLVQHFLQAASQRRARRFRRCRRRPGPRCEYPFPGNVRELAHAIEHAMVLAGGARSTSSTCPPTSPALRRRRGRTSDAGAASARRPR